VLCLLWLLLSWGDPDWRYQAAYVYNFVSLVEAWWQSNRWIYPILIWIQLKQLSGSSWWCQQSCYCWFYQRTPILMFITLPTGAVVKYCDEYVCVSVCLSVQQDISRTTHAICTKFLCMLPVAVAQSPSGRFTIGRITYCHRMGWWECMVLASVIYDCLVSILC